MSIYNDLKKLIVLIESTDKLNKRLIEIEDKLTLRVAELDSEVKSLRERLAYLEGRETAIVLSAEKAVDNALSRHRIVAGLNPPPSEGPSQS